MTQTEDPAPDHAAPDPSPAEHAEPDPQDPGPIPIDDPGPHPDDPGPIAHIKLLAAPGLKLRVVIAGGLILGIGALLAPEAAQTALSTPQERAAPLLDEQVQLREVVQPFRGVQDIPLGVREHGGAILRSRMPAVRAARDFAPASIGSQAPGFAVSVSATQFLTHAAALDGRAVVEIARPDGSGIGARVTAYEPATGLALLQAEAVVGQPIVTAATAPVTGMLAVAGAWLATGDVTIPVFVTKVMAGRYEIGTAHASVWPGMPLYNLNGEPFAIAAVDGLAYPLQQASTRLMALAADGGGPVSFGVALQDLTEELAGRFGKQGVIVSDVVPAGPADRGGLLPGDTLLAIDDMEMTTAGTAVTTLGAVAPGTPAALRIRRGGRNRTITVTSGMAFEVDALARGRADGDTASPEARVLFPAEQLERSGIPEAARVVTVNGRSVTTAAQARAAVRRGQPTVLRLRHHGDHFYAALAETSK